MLDKILGGFLFLWAGLILGVSFIATPAKFLASTLSRSSALEIGKVTFTLFNQIEWAVFGMAVVWGGFTIWQKRAFFFYTLCLLIFLLLETFYLLPSLVQQVDAIIQGQVTSQNSLHGFYVLIEISKVLWLIVGGALLVMAQSRPAHLPETKRADPI